MAKIEVFVEGLLPTDTYSYVLSMGGNSTEPMRAIQSENLSSVYISLPPGQLTENGYAASDVGIGIVRVRNGQTTRTDLLHRVVAMTPVPTATFPPGTLFNLMIAVQAYIVQHGSENAVRYGHLSASEADEYRIKTYPNASGTLAALSPAELAAVELLVYNFLLARGIDPANFRRPQAGRIGILSATERPISISDDFSISAIASSLGIRSREMGSTLMTVGAVALGVGLAASVLPLAVAGATACTVGLLMGTANGIIYDNVDFIAGDSNNFNLADSVKYFASGVIGNVLGEFGPIAKYVDTQPTAIGRFAVDQVNSFGSGVIAERITQSAESAYRAASSFLKSYTPAQTERDLPPVFNIDHNCEPGYACR